MSVRDRWAVSFYHMDPSFHGVLVWYYHMSGKMIGWPRKITMRIVEKKNLLVFDVTARIGWKSNPKDKLEEDDGSVGTPAGQPAKVTLVEGVRGQCDAENEPKEANQPPAEEWCSSGAPEVNQRLDQVKLGDERQVDDAPRAASGLCYPNQ